MNLGIDATNLRAGGGVTHLTELLGVAQPDTHGFRSIIVWGHRDTLDRISSRSWLKRIRVQFPVASYVRRIFWQRRCLSKEARSHGCSILFAPGGLYTGQFAPFVTMCRSMLPFDHNELRRYRRSWSKYRLRALRYFQTQSFRRADGLIFLSTYARDNVTRQVPRLSGECVTIPHGINPRFFCEPRRQRSVNECSRENPLRILYVSQTSIYKHHASVINAIASLRESGVPVRLDLVGAQGNAARKMQEALSKFDSIGRFMTYHGPVPFTQLDTIYRNADVFVYASTCENFPNTLLEAMASGLPIASSRSGPMPELLGDGAAYFDAENPRSIAESVMTLINRPDKRAAIANTAFQRSQRFSWESTADATFAFLARIASCDRLT